MKRLLQLIAIAVTSALAVGGCTPSAVPPAPPESECSFRTGDLPRSFCRRSMTQLLATPELFYGKPIYTYGYLQLGPGGSAGLAPSPATFEANDTIGCIQVTSFVPAPRETADALSREGTYAVQIAGDLLPPEKDICIGRLTNATISHIRRLDP